MRTLQERLNDLSYNFDEGAHEDAAGILCDLLELCRQRIKPSVRKPFATLTAMVRYYGAEAEAPRDDR
jgi:hypothetical protein